MAANRGIEAVERLAKVTNSVSAKLETGFFNQMPKELSFVNRQLAGGVLERLVKSLNAMTAAIKASGGPGISGKGEIPATGSGAPPAREPDASEAFSGRGGKLGNRLAALFGRMNEGWSKFASTMQQTQGSSTYALGQMAKGQGGLSGAGGAAAAGVGMLAGSLTNPKPFSAMGQAAGGGLALAGAGVAAAVGVPGIGTAALALGLLAAAAMSAADKIKDYGDAKLNEMFKDAEFSPQMAMVQARLDMDRMMLSMERGERNAAAAQTLAETQINLERAMMPIESAWQRGTANVGATVQGAITGPIGAAGRGADAMFGTGGWNPDAAGERIGRALEAGADERRAVEGRPRRLAHDQQPRVF